MAEIKWNVHKTIAMNYVITHPEAFAMMHDMYDLQEIPGERNNPAIIAMFQALGHRWIQTDETAWCTATVNYALMKNGYEYSDRLDARSYMSIGVPVDTPNVGDIVVFWRISKDAWQGHVGFYVRQKGSYIYVLGGNQDNRVCIKPYPKEADHYGLLGFRQMKKIA